MRWRFKFSEMIAVWTIGLVLGNISHGSPLGACQPDRDPIRAIHTCQEAPHRRVHALK